MVKWLPWPRWAQAWLSQSRRDLLAYNLGALPITLTCGSNSQTLEQQEPDLQSPGGFVLGFSSRNVAQLIVTLLGSREVHGQCVLSCFPRLPSALWSSLTYGQPGLLSRQSRLTACCFLRHCAQIFLCRYSLSWALYDQIDVLNPSPTRPRGFHGLFADVRNRHAQRRKHFPGKHFY